MVSQVVHDIKLQSRIPNESNVDKDKESKHLNIDTEKFNQEGKKIITNLRYDVKAFPNNGLNFFNENHEIKERNIINENKYARNSHNAHLLEQGISIIQYANSQVNPNENSSSDSLHDFFNEVKNSILAGKHDYLDVLKDIFSKYMQYVNDLREALSKLSQYTKAGSKDGYVNVDFDNLSDDIKAVKNKYSNLYLSIEITFIKDKDGRYYRVINGDKIYYENEQSAGNTINALEKLLNDIKGIHAKKVNEQVYPYISGIYNISIDFTDLDKFLDELDRRSKDKSDILQTEFDLFKKALDALEKRINTNLEELSKKYSAANSNYDNFVKIVSSTMNTLLEMAKGFLRF